MVTRYAAWVAFIERRHRVILLASLVVALAAALSLFTLRFDFDVLGMLPTGSPAFDDFKAFVADFGELDELVVLVEGDDRGAVERFADAFVTRLRAMDSVGSVQGKIDAEQIQQGILGRYVYNYVPAEQYARLREQLTPEGIDARVAANRAALQAPLDLSRAQWIKRDPLGLTPLAARALDAALGSGSANVSGGYLSNPDGTALLLFVRPTGSAFDIPFTTRFMAGVRAAAAAARTDTPGAQAVRVGYTGSYAFALEDAATLQRDVGRYALLALAGVLAVFYAGYRNLRILPFVTYPLVLSALLTFAASLLLYAQLNAVSLSFAAILYGLSIDSGIHYYTRLQQELQGRDIRTAVTRTLANLGGANVVASTTTAAAFLVIGFSQLVGISQLGFLTAIGMLINIMEFFVLYPALSFWMSGASLAQTLETPRLGRVAQVCASNARGVVLMTAFATIGLLIPAGRVGFDVDLTHLRPADTVASRVQDGITVRFGANRAAGAVLVRALTLEQALEDSEAIAAHLDRYRDADVARSVRGVTAVLPSERTQRQRLALFNALPRAQAVQELRTALDRHGFRSSQFDAFFAEFARPHDAIVHLGDPALDPLAPILARHVRRRGSEFTVATYVEPAAGVSLATIADRLTQDLDGVNFIVAGRSLLQEELGHLLRRELSGFCIASFVLNLLLILMNFPRLGTALAILVPEAVVIVCFFALLALTGVGVDPVNLIIVPLILGIGVDNCVYVAERWRRGEGLGEAVQRGGRALVLCSLTTMAGFGFLGLSHYPALARMGVFAATSLLLCLVAALTVLPALLSLLVPKGSATTE